MGNSTIRTAIVPNTKRHPLHGEIRKHVDSGATVNTDALRSYRGLDDEYTHNVIDHAEAYVDGQVHTNGCENFWSLLKRAIKGTYVSVEPFHLFRYLDEQTYRFNERKTGDVERFRGVLARTAGRRLMYSDLIGNADAPA
jgi:transposase-like protein